VIRTEQLLTSRAGFGIVTASPAQRAACRVLDGQPLSELAGHPDVLTLIGGAHVLAQLPSERGMMPAEAVLLASIRSAKTIIACCAAIRASQSVDVSRLGPGEVPRVSLVSLKLDTSGVAHGLLLETIKASHVLKPLLLEESADALMLRHPSGRPIEIACVAGSRAGGGLVARWSAGVIFDEAPRMAGSTDAVVNLSDARTAVLGRLLPGAQALYIGSPWAPHGPIYELVEEHWQRPTDHLVVLRGTGPMLNPQWWTAERCGALQARDPVAYRIDVCGEFADPEAGLLNPVAVQRSTRAGPLELPTSVAHASRFAAVDPAEGSASGNAWALVIVDRAFTTDEGPSFRVLLAREWRGLSPREMWRAIADACGTYGVRRCRTDQYAASANADLAQQCGLTLTIDRTSAASKLEDFTNLATLLHGGRIELAPVPALRNDLLSIRRRTTLTGSTIVLARTSDGRHSDFAPALCAAIKEASEGLALSRFSYDGVPRHDSFEPSPFEMNTDERDDDEDQDEQRRSPHSWI
jgi:hypothetical protein